MLPFRQLFKQAYVICKEYKFLWVFGLFLSFAQLLNLGLDWGGNDFGFSKISTTWQNVILIAVFIILFGLIFLYFRAKAGFIYSVKSITDKQDTKFQKSFTVSRFYYSRLLSLSVAIQLGLFILSFILTYPVIYLITQKLIVRATILGIIGGLIFIPVAIIGILIGILAPMFVVMFDLKLNDSVRQSFDLVSQYWGQLIGLAFFLTVLQFLPFVLLSFLPYDTHGLSVLIVSLIAILFIEIPIVVFVQTLWVLVFRELVKPQNLEEEEVEALPEVV